MEETCHVCMHDVQDPSTIIPCNHVYCHGCITTWISSRCAPLCPVCRAEIKGIRLADGTEQAPKPATTEQQEADLSCLDHRYFLGEVRRLLSRANSVHDRMFRDGYCCGRKGGGRASEAALSGVQELLAVLGSYRSSLEGEVRFDPEVLLAELYRLDRQLSTLSAGGTIDSSEAAAAEAAAGSGDVRAGGWYSSEGGHHHHDEDPDDGYYDEDDDGGDDWLPKGAMLSRTPGRRPTSRHQRSNSQQQQQQQQQQRGVQQQQQQRGVQQQRRGK